MNTEIISTDKKNHFQYAEVWLKQTNRRIDTFYDYRVPLHLTGKVGPGIRVVVPFGKGNRPLEGFVTSVKNESSFSEKTREILTVIDDEPVLTGPQMALCAWIHQYYCSLFYEALTPFVAPVRVIKKKSVHGQENNPFRFEAYQPKRKTEKKSFLKDEKLLSENHKAFFCDEQVQNISEEILQTGTRVFFQKNNQKKRFEIFLSIAKKVISDGGQAVILFPDVLSASAFAKKIELNNNHGWAYCCGDLKPSARYDVYKGVQSGEIRVVAGTRAALFLPYSELSVIMMDETDDSGYFSRFMPRYDTFEVAKTYALLTGAKLVLGGSELSLKIYEGIQGNRISFVQDEKISSSAIEIVDMQSELRRGNPDFISNALKKRMEKTVANHQKILLMLNRRGYASYLLCRNCGYVEKCPDCKISLKPYRDGKLHCTYCGYQKKILRNCPACGSSQFKSVGLGVEKVAEILRVRYPSWRILQIDARHFADEDVYRNIREKIDQDEWDLVIGTRALMKGFSYEHVGLAAILLMDESFNQGDYNDSEKACLLFRRFFHLSEKYALGQTYEPDNEAILGLNDDYFSIFLKNEHMYRRLMRYPPSAHLVVISLSDQDHFQVEADSRTLYHAFKATHTDSLSEVYFQIYEPVLAGIQPGTGNIRYKIMIKTYCLDDFRHMIKKIVQACEIEKLKSRVSIEIDPDET